MFIFGRCAITLDLFCITLLTSVLRISSSSYCLEGKQYYDSDQKQCLPCKICTSPFVVIATCQIYSNTKCGLPSFSGGPFLEVLQEESSKELPKTKTSTQKSNISNAYSAKSKLHKPLLSRLNKENCTAVQNGTKKFRRKLCKPNKRKPPKAELQEVNYPVVNKNNEENFTIYSSNPKDYTQDLEEENGYNLNVDRDIGLEANSSKPSVDGDFERKFFFSYAGKILVSTVVIFINLLLIVFLIVKIIKTCYKRKSKGTNCSFSYNQKLPHPSQKPIKCRFTAVLPPKSPAEYANVDSYLNSLISRTFTSTSSPCDWNDSSCTPTTLPHTSQDTEETRGGGFGAVPVPCEVSPVEREPLIPSASEVLENANTIQLYSRIPSPNPFTMDRLLEHRRAIGCTSVENNLYVETWCSSPSPMLTRSQESSVAPSPALSCVRKGLSSSTSSSPLTTRTFRATPAFTSFHPNRS